MTEFCLVYVTASGTKEAGRIADILLAKKLAACVNIYPKITSVYVWEGKPQKSSETPLVIKTRKSLYKKVEAEVKKAHSYSCPCVLMLPVDGIEKKFGAWMRGSTR